MADTKKTEVRFSVDADYLAALQSRLGLKKSSDLTKVALTLLDWASDEVVHDRTILSANKQGKDIHRLVIPELNNISKSNL